MSTPSTKSIRILLFVSAFVFIFALVGAMQNVRLAKIRRAREAAEQATAKAAQAAEYRAFRTREDQRHDRFANTNITLSQINLASLTDILGALGKPMHPLHGLRAARGLGWDCDGDIGPPKLPITACGVEGTLFESVERDSHQQRLAAITLLAYGGFKGAIEGVRLGDPVTMVVERGVRKGYRAHNLNANAGDIQWSKRYRVYWDAENDLLTELTLFDTDFAVDTGLFDTNGRP